MPTGIARPNIILLPAIGTAHAKPVSEGGMVVAEWITRKSRSFAPRPLHGRAVSMVENTTPTEESTLTLRLSVNENSQHRIDQLVETFWARCVAYTPMTLLVTDDDQADVLTSTNVEALGSGVVVEFDEADIPEWLVVGSYVLFEGPGVNDELVVVSAVTPGSPNSFTADLQVNHASSGQVIHNVRAAYQDVYLVSLEPSAVPLGKGSMVATFRCLGGVLLGSTLPS